MQNHGIIPIITWWVSISIDLKVAGTLRVPFALSLDGTRSVPTTLRTDLSGLKTPQQEDISLN